MPREVPPTNDAPPKRGLYERCKTCHEYARTCDYVLAGHNVPVRESAPVEKPICDVCGEEDSDERIGGKVEVCRACQSSDHYRIEQLTCILQRFVDGGRLESLLAACDNAGIRPKQRSEPPPHVCRTCFTVGCPGAPEYKGVCAYPHLKQCTCTGPTRVLGAACPVHHAVTPNSGAAREALGLDQKTMDEAWASACRQIRAAGEDVATLIRRAAQNIEAATPDGGAAERALSAVTYTVHGHTIRVVNSADLNAIERAMAAVRAETIEECATKIRSMHEGQERPDDRMDRGILRGYREAEQALQRLASAENKR